MNPTNKRAYVPPHGTRAPAQGRPAPRPAQGRAVQGRPAAGPAQGRAPARPTAPAYRPQSAPKRRLPAGLGRLVIGGVIAVLLAFVLQAAWPNGFPLNTQKKTETTANGVISEIHASGSIRINEIVTSNLTSLLAEDGSSPDWIELANVGNSAVSLGGYTLSKSANAANVFTFPDMTLDAGSCVLVMADSRSRQTAGEELHAPFRLSSTGDTLMLFNASGTAVDTVNIPSMPSDTAYVRMGTAQWEASAMVTPGLLNTEENYRALTEPSGDSPVVVNEIMASNQTTLTDENGQYYDYIELYNRSDASVSLSGWYLSDHADNARRWRFPELTLNPGEYLLVFASGLNRTSDIAHLHTDFSLSTEGEQVVLSNAQGKVMDQVSYDLLRADVADSRTADGSFTTSLAPSPGAANS